MEKLELSIFRKENGNPYVFYRKTPLDHLDSYAALPKKAFPSVTNFLERAFLIPLGHPVKETRVVNDSMVLVWIARDFRDNTRGYFSLYTQDRPIKLISCFIVRDPFCWTRIRSNFFPYLTWENSPIIGALILSRNE